MTVSDLRFAAQIVAPNEEPRFFDDVGCLRDYLKAHPERSAATRVFVADFRSRNWIPAEQATYQESSIATPMGSGLLAFADARAAADATPTRTGALLTADDVFGPGFRRSPGR